MDLKSSMSRNITAIDALWRSCTKQRTVKPINEERPIRETGERVMERLMVKLLFKRSTIGDVATVEQDGADIGVVEQVGHVTVHDTPTSIDVSHSTFQLDRVLMLRFVEFSQTDSRTWRCRQSERAPQPVANHVLGVATEHLQYTRALVENDVRLDQ